MISPYSFRDVSYEDLINICQFPQDESELYFMYPKATFPLTVEQLQASVNNRLDSTVITTNSSEVIGFANFNEVVSEDYCSIGNVIINPNFRGKGAGTFLVNVMETKAIEIYNVREIHISCFNTNITGLLLYHKLGYRPYEMERRLDKKNFPIALIKMKKEIKR